MPPFAFNARYGLFTFAQCASLDPFRVSNHFSSLGAECIIGREDHADGGTHLHVFADFGRKFRTRKTNAFDVDGRHPNVSPSKGTPALGWDYAVKDGEVVAGALERPGSTGDASPDGKWATIAAAPDRDSFWDLLRSLAPRDLITSYGACRAYADHVYAARTPEYEPPLGFDFPDAGIDGRDEWVRQSGIGSTTPRVGRCMSLCLYGPSKTGKTLWARSLGPHIYNIGLVSGKECLRAPDVEYAIFDDIRGGIKFFHGFKEWLGCQQMVTIKCLYKEPALTPWGKPSIWLSNTDPRLETSASDVDWLEANVSFIPIDSPIFRANTE